MKTWCGISHQLIDCMHRQTWASGPILNLLLNSAHDTMPLSCTKLYVWHKLCQAEVSSWTARHPCLGVMTGETLCLCRNRNELSVNSFPLAFMALIPKEAKIHRER